MTETEIEQQHTALDQFLTELTELSIKHGIALVGTPVLFIMEKGDYDYTYSIDDESNLSFG